MPCSTNFSTVQEMFFNINFRCFKIDIFSQVIYFHVVVNNVELQRSYLMYTRMVVAGKENSWPNRDSNFGSLANRDN